MTEGFLTIVITSPGEVDDEPKKIVCLLESGVDIVHIRKPSWTIEETRKLIFGIPVGMRNKLSLHDHFSLATEMSLGGVHLNSRNPVAPQGITRISRTCHTVEEIVDSGNCNYVTLSPIFDSISKNGYRSAFELESIRHHIQGKHVVALGGVTPDAFPILKEKGFFGAALLGYIWNGDFKTAVNSLETAIKNRN